MKSAFVVLFVTASLIAQPVSTAKQGLWRDISKDNTGIHYFFAGDKDPATVLINEDFEVWKTHEVCANVFGYFMEKSQVGRYTVNFKGMRTSAQFTFTTQYDAEKWVEKFCTPESLTQIKSGTGTLARKY